jgi:hypothetical protein
MSQPKAVKQPATTPSIEPMLEKRDALLKRKEELLQRFQAEIAELDHGIEALDSVITMFNPRHVPLDIRRVQNSIPVLTIDAQPTLTTLSEKREAKKVSTEGQKVKRGRPPKAQIASPTEVKETPEVRMQAAVKSAATKTKSTPKSKSKAEKDMGADAANATLATYFQEIDKLDTLKKIIEGSDGGLALKDIKEAFLKFHPIDLESQTLRKAFSDRISRILYGLSQQSVIYREEIVGPNGKEGRWHFVRKEDSSASIGEETSAEVAA